MGATRRALFIANFGTLVLLIGSCILSSTYIILICERPYPHVDQASAAACAWLKGWVGGCAAILGLGSRVCRFVCVHACLHEQTS